MSDAPEPELDIYCEDNAAELLIKQALPLDVRKRIRVLPVGDKGQIAAQGSFHLWTRLKNLSDMLLVWDGEVGLHEVAANLKKANLTEEKLSASELRHLN